MNVDFLLQNVKTNGELTAIVSDGNEYTFDDIYNEYINAGLVLDQYHIGKGNVVSVIAEFSPRSIAYVICLVERDSVIVPISNTLKQTDGYIRISETEYVIDLSREEKIIKTGATVDHALLKELIKRENPGLILFSSGTTGEPKAALHDLSFLMEKFKTPGKRLSTVTFLLFDHIGGFNTMMHSLSSGSMIVTLKDRSPEEVCKLIEKYSIELLPTSPTFINMIILSRAYERYDLSSLKLITYGTEPMPESSLNKLHEILPDVRLKQTYGLSEVGIMSTKSESSDSLYMKIGGAGYETKIVDDILYIRARSAMMGYLNAPSPFDDDGWFNTKDKVIKKGEYIKILGRTTDIINVGGEKVYPNEVESVILLADGVKDVYVYGEDNPITGKVVIAEVCVESENNNREYIRYLRRYCSEHLERFKCPTKYKLTDKAFYGERFKKKR
ncbi:MAG: long-chain fatty acid--CoA ligase [Lachnospiraceae bacterium]|nr:long-chain fatty acid--CoA ligase [Lachnospiraceae bacterium]